MSFWGEIRHLPRWLDGAGPKVNLGLMALILGVGLPWLLGFEYLDPLVLTGVALASVVFPAAAAGPAGWGARTGEIAPRVGAIAVGGFLYGVLTLALGVAVVNARNWYGTLLAPAAVHVITLPLLPAALAGFVAAESVRLADKGHKPREIGARFRWTVLIVVMAWYFRASWMPRVVSEALDQWLTSRGIAVATAGLSVALAAAAVAQVRRLKMVRLREHGTS